MKRNNQGRYTRKEIILQVDEKECFNCVSHYLDDKGYPMIKDTQASKTKKMSRYLWEKHKGKIPNGMCVLHKCDNRQCVNLSHLFLGTHQENMDDRNKKGRQAKGERNGNVKLTEQQITDIRDSNKPQFEIAWIYGVHNATISRIKSRKIWKNVN